MTPSPFNPYEAPKASFELTADMHGEHEGMQCWRHRDILIAPVDAHLPPRCIKCNEPAGMESPRAYLWHHPAWYILMPVLVYMVVCLFVRKRAVVVLGLCEEHRRRRRNRLWAAYIVGAVGVIGLGGAVYLGYWLAIPAAVLILIATALAVSVQELVQPVRITAHEIHLKGCGAAFLDSLPRR